MGNEPDHYFIARNRQTDLIYPFKTVEEATRYCLGQVCRHREAQAVTDPEQTLLLGQEPSFDLWRFGTDGRGDYVGRLWKPEGADYDPAACWNPDLW